MVRNYKKKTVAAQWTDEDMIMAIKTVNEGKAITGTAKLYGIPRTMLQQKLYDYDAQKKRTI